MNIALIREFIITALDDHNGLNATAAASLKKLCNEYNFHDILQAIDEANGRFYLTVDAAELLSEKTDEVTECEHCYTLEAKKSVFEITQGDDEYSVTVYTNDKGKFIDVVIENLRFNTQVGYEGTEGEIRSAIEEYLDKNWDKLVK